MENSILSEARGIQAIDLGLPSGLKWCTCNLGANSENEYGYYFQWGDVNGGTGYDAKIRSVWETCPFNDGKDVYNAEYFNEVYNDVCPNGILSPDYDAVVKQMGNGWRMPTMQEWEELKVNTEVEKVVCDGVRGRKFTGDNGNYIFIPANGYYSKGNLYYEEAYGELWSSSVGTHFIQGAWSFEFKGEIVGVNNYARYIAKAIRGVKE